jgi:pimeloyl-ACP methyl ester carboxylesterase
MNPAYIDKGSGQAVFFANGAVSDYRAFEAQIEALSKEYRVVAPNLRSQSRRGQRPYTLWDLADDYKALMDALDIERAVIAGWSTGGYVGLRFAQRYPERLAGLVMLGSTALPNTPEEEVAFLAKFHEMGQHEKVPKEWGEWCAGKLFGAKAKETNPALVQTWIERWATYSVPDVIMECRCWLNREDMTPVLRTLKVPTLIIHGEEDAAIPIERTAPMAKQMPNARLIALPKIGHFLSVEAPNEVTSGIREFLRSVYAFK